MSLKKIGSGLLDLIFPPPRACPFCGCFHPEANVCEQCAGLLDGFLKEPVCSICGRFFTDQKPSGWSGERTELICRECREIPRAFVLARAAGPYEGIMKEAIHKLKYQNNRRLVTFLARYMLQAAGSNPLFAQAGAVVPVPLSPGRLGERGFNQSELLARELAYRMGLPMLKAVQKIMETPAQTGLDQFQRKNNLKGAFSVSRKKMVENKTLLLVDDVITTLSTMEAVAGVLLENGALSVLGLAAASGRTGA